MPARMQTYNPRADAGILLHAGINPYKQLNDDHTHNPHLPGISAAPQVQIDVNPMVPHDKQAEFVYSESQNIITCAGRQSGKTAGISIRGVHTFMKRRSFLYCAPSIEQTEEFWNNVCNAMHPLLTHPLMKHKYKKREDKREIRLIGTDIRLQARTGRTPDALRGGHFNEVCLDEFQLMHPGLLDAVIPPMLGVGDGTLILLYTPYNPLSALGASSAKAAEDRFHATHLWNRVLDDPEWHNITFKTVDSPYFKTEVVERIKKHMSSFSQRRELEADQTLENPDALWSVELIQAAQLKGKLPEQFARIVVAVDPSGSKRGDDVGIVVVGLSSQAETGKPHAHVLADVSGHLSPRQWGQRAVAQYEKWAADNIVAEVNFGGDMVEEVIHGVDEDVRVKKVRATRGKAVRAEPVVAKYENDQVIHAKPFSKLEGQLTQWAPGDKWSPGRLDALVWGVTELLVKKEKKFKIEVY